MFPGGKKCLKCTHHQILQFCTWIGNDRDLRCHDHCLLGTSPRNFPLHHPVYWENDCMMGVYAFHLNECVTSFDFPSNKNCTSIYNCTTQSRAEEVLAFRESEWWNRFLGWIRWLIFPATCWIKKFKWRSLLDYCADIWVKGKFWRENVNYGCREKWREKLMRSPIQLWGNRLIRVSAKGSSSLSQPGIQVSFPFRCVMWSWIE